MEILVSRVYSVKPSQKPRQLLARRTTFLPRLFNQSRTVLNRTYGHLVCFCMKCAHYNHHLMRKVSINSQGRLSLDSIMKCLTISARISRIFYRECLMWTPKRDQTLTQSWDTQLSLNAFKNCLRKTILETSFPTLFCTTRTYSMNSRQSRQLRKRRRRENKSWQLRRPREHSREWLSCVSMNTSPSMVKTRSSLMRCSCTTSTNCTNRMNKAASRPHPATQRPFRRDHSRSRPQ